MTLEFHRVAGSLPCVPPDIHSPDRPVRNRIVEIWTMKPTQWSVRDHVMNARLCANVLSPGEMPRVWGRLGWPEEPDED